jgi:hypothetical protein
VTNPLSVTKFLTHPCDLLTKAQARKLGATKAGKPDKVSGHNGVDPICNWHNTEALVIFSTSIITGDQHGLNDIYRANREPGYFDFFNPTTVKGYPGVFVGANDNRMHGTCALDFAVNGHAVLRAGYIGNGDTKDPCAKVKEVASAVVTTIKEGS